MADSFSCALVLLAAGASTRMGRPKQLLPVGDRPLLCQVAGAALAAPVSPVIVVLGAHAAEIAPSLGGLGVHLVVNDGWSEGMGSSIRAGMETLLSLAPAIDGVVIVLADQADFSASHVARLLDVRRQTGRSMIASQFRGALMPPALFAAEHFPCLCALQGDAGARSLLQARADEVGTVPLAAVADLDTPSDYTAYLGRNSR